MLPIPTDPNNTFHIVGIDPGTTMLGVSLLKVDITSLKILSSEAWTLNAERLMGQYQWTELMHGARTCRIHALHLELLKIFNYYNPLLIVSEAPFINGRFPQAGIALTEVLSAIRQAVIAYDQWKSLYIVPPSSVKNAVRAPGNANKDVMKQRLLELTELNYIGEVPMIKLDEHSIDALAVAYSKWKELG